MPVHKRSSRAVVVFLLVLAGFHSARAKDSSPVFFHTLNSDEWVEHSIQIQKKYRRVLVVDASGKSSRKMRVPSLELNSRANVNGQSSDYRVAATFKTLQGAADAAIGGDLVAVMPGHYAGFVMEDKASAGDGRYVHFKAMGEPGDVVIDQAS